MRLSENNSLQPIQNIMDVAIFDASAPGGQISQFPISTTRHRRGCFDFETLSLVHHRLNGSSSSVLTATCLSYGRLCDFLGFFPNRPGGHTPRPILTQNGSNDVGSRKDVPFGVKIATFWNPWPPDPQNRQNLPNFGRDVENFRSILRLTLEASRVNTP